MTDETEFDQVLTITDKELEENIIALARQLIELTRGDVDGARLLWECAFKEAERLDHNQQMEIEADTMDNIERTIVEQGERFDKAAEARSKFHTVKNKPDKEDES